MVVKVGKDVSGRIKASFFYDSQLVARVKTIEGRKWHKDEKYRSFPNTDGSIEKILKAFEGEEIYINPMLKGTASDLRTGQGGVPSPFIASDKAPKQSQFEDLRGELISRKYSYKTVKGHLYYNKDFLNFVRKEPQHVTYSDIKNYLFILPKKSNQPPQHLIRL